MRPRGPVLLGGETCTANSPKPRLSVLFTCIYVLTVTFNVSAPLRLGEGTRTGVTAQRLGGRGPGSGPWTAVLAPSPPGVACFDPTALHPASIQADRFPDTGGQSASTRAREDL